MNSDDLDDRIAEARAQSGRHGPGGPDDERDPGIESAMSFGLRAGAQFVSAAVLGGGLGWAIDRWLGTRPFGMLVLMMLSFIAAMTNVWRSMSKAVDEATKAALSKDGETAKDEVSEEFDGKPAETVRHSEDL